MSSDWDSDGSEGGDDVLVAEYALGLLPAAERQAFERRLRDDQALRRELELWQGRFGDLDQGFAEVPAPANAWKGIETRLFPAAVRSSWWDSLALWRGLAGAGVAVAVAAVGFNLLRPAPTAEAIATELVAALRPNEGSGIAFVAFYDTATEEVRIVGLGGEQPSGKDYELWYIAGDDPAVSMGVIPVDQRTQIELDEAARQKIAEGTTLAVTLEPEGGSPTGVATGPIVSVGTAMAI